MALKVKLDPEQPVVQAMLAGDAGAFEEFMRRHEKWVFGVIYGVLGDADRSEDVSQQVWSRVWQQIGTLVEPEHWRTWLYRMARNAAVDAGRAVTRQRKLNRGFAGHTRGVGRVEGGEAPVDSDEKRQLLYRALRGLPDLYREPFVLRHLEGWSYREIAEVLEMPVDTVETRLVRARRQLREALKNRL